MPYKGFSYYGPLDVALFAGREEEVLRFARLVGHPDTRILLLQGATGCGKSSFLRAGLIPYLEGGFRGFEFVKTIVKTEDRETSKALLIRSTDAPLEKLAAAVFDFVSKGYEFESPFGIERLDLRKALLGCQTPDEFVRTVVETPRQLVESLEKLASELPTTLVVVIDQGEEVLTLGAGPDAERSRNKFFEFLALFSETQMPLKLIIALRTDYQGRFQARIRRPARDAVNVRDDLLDNLGDEDLVHAIERPTLRTPIAGYGVPYEYYRFSFDKGLPEQIVKDLKATAEAEGLVGGALPVLQVVCETLYKSTRHRGDGGKYWTITYDDYRALGEIETQLGDYVDQVLSAFYQKKKKEMTDYQVALQTLYWKDVLSVLAKTQVDNTIATDLKTIDELARGADKVGLKYFGEMMEYLADDEQNVLRKERVKRLGSSQPVECFSLRHDAIGLVLLRWKTGRQTSRSFLQPFRILVQIEAIAFAVGGSILSAISLWKGYSDQDWTTNLLAAVAGFVILLGGLSFLRYKFAGQEFLPYRLVLLLPYGLFSRHRAERMRGLMKDPVFRLLQRSIRTQPSWMERLLEMARRGEKKGSGVSS